MATLAQAAAHLFISPTRFRQLVDSGAIERQPAGAYDLDKVREAAFAQLRAVASARGTSLRLSDERALLSKRQRELVELKTAKLRGAVVEIELVGEAVERNYAVIKEKLFAVPFLAADKCVGQDRNVILETLRGLIVDVLTELYEPARVILEAGGDPNAERAAAGPAERPTGPSVERVPTADGL